MADIKTRDVVKGTVRTIDKAAVAGQRMKHAYIATKEKAEHSVEARETSTEEYAADRLRQVRIPLYTKALTLWIKQVAKAFRPQRKISSRQKTAWNALSRSEPNSPYDGRHLNRCRGRLPRPQADKLLRPANLLSKPSSRQERR